MNSYFPGVFTSLAMGIDDIFLTGMNAISFIICMSILVFGLLLLRITIKLSRGLFISSLISYILMLFIMLWIYLWGKCFPDITNIFQT